MPVLDAGVSQCPICSRKWLVTPLADCCLPTCGCYGSDTGANNQARPCQPCGIAHALKCERMPSRDVSS